MESLKPIDKETLTAGLTANTVIRTLSYHQRLDSTNVFAASLVRTKTFDNGTVVVADEQTAGQGRLGRSWFSPKYSNIYASIILKDELAANHSFFMTMIASVCVKNALQTHCGLTAQIKWPNDVMIGKKKIAGILIERLDGFFIVGIGLNVNMEPDQSLELRNSATSVLKETGLRMGREGLILGLLSCFEASYAQYRVDLNGIFMDWKNSLVWPDRPVDMIIEGKKLRALPVGVQEDGGLVVSVNRGKKTVYTADYA